MLNSDIRLRTARCLFRPISRGEADAVHAALTHPGFSDYLLDPPPQCLDETNARLEAYERGWRTGTRFVFASFRGDEFAGVLGLRPFGAPTTWNIGFWVVPAKWGNGLAGEFARAGIEIGFSYLGAVTMRLAHAVENERSRRVIARLLLKEAGESSFEKCGVLIRERVYHLDRADWQPTPGLLTIA